MKFLNSSQQNNWTVIISSKYIFLATSSFSNSETFHKIFEELNLPRIPSFLINTTAKTDPITSAAKIQRLLGEKIFFSVDYTNDYLNNSKNIITLDGDLQETQL